MLEKDVNDTERSLKDVNATLHEHIDAARETNKFIETGQGDIVDDADQHAASALQAIVESEKNVESLDAMLDGLEGVELKELESSEDELKSLGDEVERMVNDEINTMLKKLVEQEHTLEVYEADLSELRRQVTHNDVLFNALPTTCYKVASAFEQ